jgi:hypothetical protein
MSFFNDFVLCFKVMLTRKSDDVKILIVSHGQSLGCVLTSCEIVGSSSKVTATYKILFHREAHRLGNKTYSWYCNSTYVPQNLC